MGHWRWVLIGVFALSACATRQPLPLTPPDEIADAPVARVPIGAPEPTEPAAAVPTAPVAGEEPAKMAKTEKAARRAPRVPIVKPPVGTLYVCAADAKGHYQQVAIEFIPRVERLCRKHPEMGPCQYEREACRRSGGRVFTADGTEITKQIEAQYDKRVLRVRLRAD